jgi:hypothetical protein
MTTPQARLILHQDDIAVHKALPVKEFLTKFHISQAGNHHIFLT